MAVVGAYGLNIIFKLQQKWTFLPLPTEILIWMSDCLLWRKTWWIQNISLTAVSSHKLGRWYNPSTWKKRCHVSLFDEMDNQRRETKTIATKIIDHTFMFWPVLWLKLLLFAGPEPSDTDSTTEKLLEGFSHRLATSIWSITSGVRSDHKPTLFG